MLQEYDRDFNWWIQEQTSALKAREFARLDYNNLIEEIESMGRQERRQLVNRLTILIGHLLKWAHQPERRCASWEITIKTQRNQIARHLKKHPSLKPYLPEAFEEAYDDGRSLALSETGLPPDQIPELPDFDLNFALFSDGLEA